MTTMLSWDDYDESMPAPVMERAAQSLREEPLREARAVQEARTVREERIEPTPAARAASAASEAAPFSPAVEGPSRAAKVAEVELPPKPAATS
ncbi:MAG TPA: hypothetical protein VMJ74_13630, partial [Pseudomonadales bacterium]|nr:hypothetical protein [Pseudomonadales bacterium]